MTPIDELPEGHYVENSIQGRQPAIPLKQKSCVTAGNSIRNETWDKVCGRFAVETRMLNIHTMGTKRGLGLDPENYETVRNPDGSLRLARRCTQLVQSSSRSNPHPHLMSAPLCPKWVEKAPLINDDADERVMVSCRNYASKPNCLKEHVAMSDKEYLPPNYKIDFSAIDFSQVETEDAACLEVYDDAVTFVSLFAPEPAINANRAALAVRLR